MSDISSFAFPTQIRFGVGAVNVLPDVAKTVMKRPLLLTDPGIARTPVLPRIREVLAGGGLEVALFDGVQGNPTVKDVDGALAVYRDGKCDGVIGVGGGSPLDVAKAVALMATHSGSIFEYDDALDGWQKVRPDVPPVITVPTTAGTGSEVGRSTVITNTEIEKKVVIFSPHLMPKFAVIDPELAVGLPPAVTAATGMDALTHNVEAFLATGYHPMCDGIALEGIRQCSLYLRRAVENGQDLEARAGMAMASMMGAVAFQKGLGATHSLAHPLSAVCHLHHGLANGILVARVMEWNADVSRDRLARIGMVVGGHGTDAELARGAVRFVRELAAVIGIPQSLGAAGVEASQIDHLSDLAAEDSCHRSNPKPCTRNDFKALYSAAL